MRVTLESIERLGVFEKDDWQRKVNQGVLKEDLKQSLAALGAIDALDRFLYTLRLEAKREEVYETESRKVQSRIAEMSPISRRKAGAR